MLCFTPCSRDLDSDRLCVVKRGKRWVEMEVERQRDSKLRIQRKSASRSLITLSSCDLTLSRMLSRALLSQRKKGGEGLVKKWIKRIKKQPVAPIRIQRATEKAKGIIYHLVLVFSFPPALLFCRRNWKIIHCPCFEDWFWGRRQTALSQNKRSSNGLSVWQFSKSSLQTTLELV